MILHELGHFAAAKAVGMRVERFSLFFPPILVSKKVGETEYAIGAIPLGGYVKISGMNPDEDLPDEVRDRAYHAQPVWKRIVVIAAGPAVNLVLAFVLLFVFFWAIGAGDADARGRRGRARLSRPPACSSRATGSWRWTGSAGRPAELSREISAPPVPRADSPATGCRPPSRRELTVVRDGRAAHARRSRRSTTRTATETAAACASASATRPSRGPTLPLGEAVDTTADRFWFITKATLELPARLIDPEQRKEISGVVGSYEITRQTILDDVEDVIAILAIISLSLAIVNLFPFLPLDGGHIFWAIVEKVRRKPVPLRVMERAGVVGFMLVILIFLIGFSNDIDRLSGEGFQVR